MRKVVDPVKDEGLGSRDVNKKIAVDARGDVDEEYAFAEGNFRRTRVCVNIRAKICLFGQDLETLSNEVVRLTNAKKIEVQFKFQKILKTNSIKFRISNIYYKIKITQGNILLSVNKLSILCA